MRTKKQQSILLKLGEVISKRRAEKGYSRLKLSIELNTDEKQLRRIEKGEVNPTILTLLKIFHYLEIDVKSLEKIKIDNTTFED